MAAAEPPSDTPHDVDVERYYAKVIALNRYLFDELQFAGERGPTTATRATAS